MDWQLPLVAAMVLAAAGFVGRAGWRTWAGGCGGCGKCVPAKPEPAGRRVALAVLPGTLR